jgi:hypothetical protein
MAKGNGNYDRPKTFCFMIGQDEGMDVSVFNEL